MNTMTEEVVEEVTWELGPKDRCDSCAAEALVRVTGLSGDLMFCGHHYNKIMDNPEGYKSMMGFAITILDERDKLIENRAKGSIVLVYEYYVRKVEAVVDGDTIDVLIDLGFDILFASRVRLAGIDTPESRTKDLAEKALGLEAKEYLKKALKDAKSVVIKTEKMDSSEKYGRILGWVYINGDTVSLNDMMINDGYAWGYLGDTKVKDFDALAKARKKSGK